MDWFKLKIYKHIRNKTGIYLGTLAPPFNSIHRFDNNGHPIYLPPWMGDYLNLNFMVPMIALIVICVGILVICIAVLRRRSDMHNGPKDVYCRFNWMATFIHHCIECYIFFGDHFRTKRLRNGYPQLNECISISTTRFFPMKTTTYQKWIYNRKKYFNTEFRRHNSCFFLNSFFPCNKKRKIFKWINVSVQLKKKKNSNERNLVDSNHFLR